MASSQQKKIGGPPLLYPESGRLVPRTIFLPADVIEWAAKHPQGLGGQARESMLKDYRKAENRKKSQ